MNDTRMDLHGMWKRSVGGRALDYVSVPGGYTPLGECLLETEFVTPWPEESQDRLFLVTEGVLASAEFVLNGTALGKAGPYCRYRLEIPTGTLRDDNVLCALVKDMNETFGTTPGRLFQGGLIRPIWLERRPAAFIDDIHFMYDLTPDNAQALCTVHVAVNGESNGLIVAQLIEVDTGREVGGTTGPAGQPLSFAVNWPRLWSPERPVLYKLTVTLEDSKRDSISEQVGFRCLEVRGQDFYLNGSRLILRGVCRHEFTTASGYSPTPEEARHELAMIKHAGFNYVRLVHSPQAPWVPRLAAELGLLVSEEPGTCWHDLGDEQIVAPAVEALRRTVLRDRNVPSIFAWLIYNECLPNSDYAVRIARMIRSLNPGCLLSMADCSWKDHEILAMVKAGDLSYYGINQYSPTPSEYCKRMETFRDRPLVFTEWGACPGNTRDLRGLCDSWVIHSRADEPLRIAGCTYWAWADYMERSRALPTSEDGWTTECLLDKEGRPRPDLQTLSLMCFAMANPAPIPTPKVEILAQAPVRTEPWQTVSLASVMTQQSDVEATVAAMRREYRRYTGGYLPMQPLPPVMPRIGKRIVDGIEFVCRDQGSNAAPLLLGRGVNEVVIPINRSVEAVAVLGHVAIVGGYPASTVSSVFHDNLERAVTLGEPVAEYVFVFADREVTVPLRHGLEILRANDICRWWQTAPRAPHTRPAITSMISSTYESLRIDLWEKVFERPGQLQAIHWRLKDPNAILALWAVSVRTGSEQ